MRTVICLLSLCIGCIPNAASLATPAQYSVVSAPGSQAMQANRDHYRYKKWYQNDQRRDASAAEFELAPGDGDGRSSRTDAEGPRTLARAVPSGPGRGHPDSALVGLMDAGRCHSAPPISCIARMRKLISAMSLERSWPPEGA